MRELLGLRGMREIEFIYCGFLWHELSDARFVDVWGCGWVCIFALLGIVSICDKMTVIVTVWMILRFRV